jgi:ribosomal protein S18 acetylase RimI-like enzyme
MRREIRRPVGQDAAAMGRAHVRAWQAAYRGVMPNEFLDGLRIEDRQRMWQRQIASPGDEGILVSVADGSVVGFAVFGCSAEDASLGELYAINLDPDHWGLGLGRELLQTVTNHLAEAGFTELVLWVAPANDRARGLYESEGWTTDGTTREDDVLGVSVTQMRYRRVL